MKVVKLTHANLKVPILVAVNKIFYMYTSPTHGCVHIISDGGAIGAVAESEEQILSLINNNEQMENKTNGITGQT